MRRGESGVILVNVLVALALGAAMVTLMLTSQDVEIDRARRAAALAQAEAIAVGAEASVLVALRRDMTDAPETDHLDEAWASVVQQEVVLGTGLFSVTLRDLHARFDVNSLKPGNIVAAQGLLRLITVLGLPPDTSATILGAIAQRGRLSDLDDVAGLAPRARDGLVPYLTFLDGEGGVNLNTAAPEILTATIGNASAATRLLALRARAGFLTPGDLTDVGVVGVAGAGFTSDDWEAAVSVEVDGVTLLMTTRFKRIRTAGRTDVEVVSRRFGPAAGPLPPLPETTP